MTGAEWVFIGIIVVLALGAGWAVAAPMTPPANGNPILPFPRVVIVLAQAIAFAEGFYVAGSKPQRQNNPGSLTSGSGTILSYATAEDGWNALYDQVQAMFTGQSVYYNVSMSISSVAYWYADGAHDPQGATNWARNVASQLGVTPDTTLATLAAQFNA